MSKNQKNFKDLHGRAKFVQEVNGLYIHTGNANYIDTEKEGVVFHPVNKIVKATIHSLKRRK